VGHCGTGNARPVPLAGREAELGRLIAVYNAAGYFEPNGQGAYSVNSITAARNGDGSVTVHFGGCGDGRPNCLPVMDGWNYLVRLYRPRAEILNGTWSFPTIEPAA
jgi:hypothetical protein